MKIGRVSLPLLSLLATTLPSSKLFGLQQQPAAVFPVAFYGKGANSLEQGDSSVAGMTDSILRSDLQSSGRLQLVASDRISRAVADPLAMGAECASLDCRRSVSRKVGAEWMVTAKLSKTSNLIWYL